MRNMFLLSAATVLVSVTAAVIATLDSPECPALYNLLYTDGPCVTAYGLHETDWLDAQLYCNSIFGELLVVKNATLLADLVQYFNQTGIIAHFWIGGYESSEGGWSWTDGSPMTMGAPFWTVKPYDCTYSKCKYGQAPYVETSSSNSKNSSCVSLSSTYFYYFDNVDCSKKMSPLCIFTGSKDPELEVWEE